MVRMQRLYRVYAQKDAEVRSMLVPVGVMFPVRLHELASWRKGIKPSDHLPDDRDCETLCRYTMVMVVVLDKKDVWIAFTPS